MRSGSLPRTANQMQNPPRTGDSATTTPKQRRTPPSRSCRPLRRGATGGSCSTASSPFRDRFLYRIVDQEAVPLKSDFREDTFKCLTAENFRALWICLHKRERRVEASLAGRHRQGSYCFARRHIWRTIFAGRHFCIRFHEHGKFPMGKHLNLSSKKIHVYGTASGFNISPWSLAVPT